MKTRSAAQVRSHFQKVFGSASQEDLIDEVCSLVSPDLLEALKNIAKEYGDMRVIIPLKLYRKLPREISMVMKG